AGGAGRHGDGARAQGRRPLRTVPTDRARGSAGTRHEARGLVHFRVVSTNRKDTNKEALDYHSSGRPGKIEVISSKSCKTARDLSLAYTPGVAQPCIEIFQNPK